MFFLHRPLTEGNNSCIYNILSMGFSFGQNAISISSNPTKNC